jgi:hypothetical protein
MSLSLPAAVYKVVVGTHSCYPTHQVALSSFLLLLAVVVDDGNSSRKMDTAVADHSYYYCYNSRNLVVVVAGCTGRNSLQMMLREEEADGDEDEGVGFYHLLPRLVEKVDLTWRQDHQDHLMELLLVELSEEATSYYRRRRQHKVVVVEVERDRKEVEELAAAFAVAAAFGVLYQTLYE